MEVVIAVSVLVMRVPALRDRTLKCLHRYWARIDTFDPSVAALLPRARKSMLPSKHDSVDVKRSGFGDGAKVRRWVQGGYANIESPDLHLTSAGLSGTAASEVCRRRSALSIAFNFTIKYGHIRPCDYPGHSAIYELTRTAARHLPTTRG
jgi:hypothetical protein